MKKFYLSLIYFTFFINACHMGNPHLGGDRHKDQDDKTYAELRWQKVDDKLPIDSCLVHYSIFDGNDKYVQAKEKIVPYLKSPNKSNTLSQAEDRSIGIMLGMACGDSLGAPFEFLPFKKEGYNEVGRKITMNKDNLSGYAKVNNQFQLKPGQWTDDTSMGLCLADILLQGNGILDDTQLMWSFIDWWDHGYNNAFAKDPKHSIGLGGNISQSFAEFEKLNLTRKDLGPLPTKAGDKYTSGNGSLMRNGPSAIVAKTAEQARSIASQQSKVTHQGEEAAAASELMSYMMFNAIHDSESDPQKVKKNVFDKLKDFNCQVESVNALARHNKDATNTKSNELENWDFTADNLSYNTQRLASSPGYIGSYAMDALAMALHCVYTTNSFEDAVLKAISVGGDADSVGAVTGQIAGSIYGAKSINPDWIEAVQQWDREGEIAVRGYLLFNLIRKP